MIFVIPMAGRGQRFTDAGFTLPKMLIQAKGKTLLEWSVDSLPLELCSKLILIGLKEHKLKFELDKFVEQKYGKLYNVTQIYLDDVTRGQSETVLKAEKQLNPDEGLLIYNIDTAFKSDTIVNSLQRSDINGVLGSFIAAEPSFSFAKLKPDGYISEVAEKIVISNNALTGLYHFAKAGDFIEVAHQAIANRETVKNEYYIAPLYNKLIAKGHKFIIDQVAEFNVLGTPEELNSFLHD